MINTLNEVTSPSDWPEDLPELRNIDNLLRCSICKEFFEVAMLIQECAHNYCSLCIRQSINHKTQCPTCSIKVSCNDLKCNKVLDELVINFVKVRSKLLELLNSKKASTILKNTKDEISDNDSEDMFMKTPKGKNIVPKRKLSKGKSPRLRKRKRPKVESDSDDSEDNTIYVKQEPCTPDRKTEPVKSSLLVDKPSSSAGVAAQGQPADNVSSIVECPVCCDMIDSTCINKHLDVCLTREEKKSSLRSKPPGSSGSKSDERTPGIPAMSASSLASPPTSSLSSSSSPSSPPKQKTLVSGSNAFIASSKPKRKQLPPLVYTLLSEKVLKQKLKQWNLSTQGNRQTLVKRHQEFVTIYNAECDSSNPKPAAVIVKEMEKRAKQKQSKKFMTASTSAESTMHSLTKESSVEEVEQARQACLDQHGDQFQQLINNVRMRRKKAANRNTQKEQADRTKPSTSQIIDIDKQDTMIIQDTKQSLPETKTEQHEEPSSTTVGNKIDNKTTKSFSTLSNVNQTSVTIDNRTTSKEQQKSSSLDNKRISKDDTVEKHEQQTSSSSSSDEKQIILVDDENPACDSQVDDEGSSLFKDGNNKNIHNEDTIMQDVSSDQNSARMSIKDQECRVSGCESQSAPTSSSTDRTVVPEPPSLSSLVFESQIDSADDDMEERDEGRLQNLDSSPTLGLESDHEMRETDHDSDSDSELFRTEIVRSPVKPARSLRSRKR